MAKKITLTDDMLNLVTIPNITEDKQWLEMFQSVMDRKMRNQYKEIQILTAKRKDLEVKLKQFKKEKKVLMNKILVYSDEVNSQGNNKSIMLLEEARDKIVVINDTIDDIMYQLETLPSEIRSLNYELLKSSIAIAYHDLSENKGKVDYLNFEIDRIRDKLFAMKEQKQVYDGEINKMYSYLHKTIGHKNTENLDEIFL